MASVWDKASISLEDLRTLLKELEELKLLARKRVSGEIRDGLVRDLDVLIESVKEHAEDSDDIPF